MRNKHFFIRVRRHYTGVLLISILTLVPVFAQKKGEMKMRENWRQGNEAFARNKIPDAETCYRKGLHYQSGKAELSYNLGNTLMKRGQYREALEAYHNALQNTADDKLKSSIYHNRGNAYMKLKQYDKAVEAYKNSLRKNPQNEQTRYNLALAMQYLEKQRQNQPDNQKQKQPQSSKDDKRQDQNKQEQNNQNQNQQKQNKEENGQNKEKDKNGQQKDKKDTKNKDKGEKKEENSSGEKKNEQKPESGNQTGTQKKEASGGKKEGTISPLQMKRLLKAMENEEKKTMKKVRFKKAKVKSRKKEKDW